MKHRASDAQDYAALQHQNAQLQKRVDEWREKYIEADQRAWKFEHELAQSEQTNYYLNDTLTQAQKRIEELEARQRGKVL